MITEPTYRPYVAMQWEIEALLTGRKTRITVPMDPQPIIKDGAWYWSSPRYDNGDGVHYFHTEVLDGVLEAWANAGPLGVPGDRIWVRENHYVWTGCGDLPATFNRHLCYSDHPEIDMLLRSACVSERSPVQMPRWASRITLDVTSVRVERVQSVTEREAKENGCDALYHELINPSCPIKKPHYCTGAARGAKADFEKKWQSRYCDRFPWSGNPWVFVVPIRRVT